jgi:hypothetical protein
MSAAKTQEKSKTPRRHGEPGEGKKPQMNTDERKEQELFCSFIYLCPSVVSQFLFGFLRALRVSVVDDSP